jgi:hypothetical protein
MPSKLTRVTQNPFGTSGPTGDFGAFGSKALNPSSPVFTQNPSTIQSLAPFSEGWGQAIVGNYEPPMEDMNGLFLLTFYQLGYILQMGLPEYDIGTTYFQYSRCQYNGVSYVSLQNNNIGNEPDTSPTYWQASSANVYGGSVASASSLTLPNLGSSFKVTGTTTINNISIQTAGIIVELIFTGTLTVNTGGNILLNDGAFLAIPNATLTLISDGTNWFELSRSPSQPGIGSVVAMTSGSTYQATTAVWVKAYMLSGNITLTGYMGPTGSLGTQMDICNASSNSPGLIYGNIGFLVPKGFYFQVVASGGSANIYYQPIGN